MISSFFVYGQNFRVGQKDTFFEIENVRDRKSWALPPTKISPSLSFPKYYFNVALNVKNNLVII